VEGWVRKGTGQVGPPWAPLTKPLIFLCFWLHLLCPDWRYYCCLLAEGYEAEVLKVYWRNMSPIVAAHSWWPEALEERTWFYRYGSPTGLLSNGWCLLAGVLPLGVHLPHSLCSPLSLWGPPTLPGMCWAPSIFDYLLFLKWTPSTPLPPAPPTRWTPVHPQKEGRGCLGPVQANNEIPSQPAMVVLIFHLSYLGGIGRRITVQAGPRANKVRLYLKNN
jgi:hypothetical protein